MQKNKQTLAQDLSWHWLMFTTRIYLFGQDIRRVTLCKCGFHKLTPFERSYKNNNDPWIKTAGLRCIICNIHYFKTLDDQLNFITIESEKRDSFKRMFEAMRKKNE